MNSGEMMYAARCEYLDKAYEYLIELIEESAVDNEVNMDIVNITFYTKFPDLTKSEIEEISLRLESEGY